MNEGTARKQLAENLRVLRLLRGWSQEFLADTAGIDRSYVGGIERAERNLSLDHLERLARAFNLPVHELLRAPDPAEVGARLLENIRRDLAHEEKPPTDKKKRH